MLKGLVVESQIDHDLKHRLIKLPFGHISAFFLAINGLPIGIKFRLIGLKLRNIGLKFWARLSQLGSNRD